MYLQEQLERIKGGRNDKVCMSEEYLILDEKKTKQSIKKQLRLKKSIHAGYKLNIKPVAFYNKHEYKKKKSRAEFHSHQPQEIKNLLINLTKEIKDCYNESYKALMKEIIREKKQRHTFFVPETSELIPRKISSTE